MRLRNTMIDNKTIDEVKKRLVNVYKPLEIYLFGSYVWSVPTKDSDLDLVVIVEKSDEKSYKRSMAGDRALYGMPLAWDLIVYTKDEFSRFVDDISTLCYKIKKEGKKIYSR